MCIFENSLKQLVWMFSYWILKGKRIIWVPAKESGGREGGQEERGDLCRCMVTRSSSPPSGNHFTHPWLVESREQRKKTRCMIMAGGGKPPVAKRRDRHRTPNRVHGKGELILAPHPPLSLSSL